MIIKLKNVEYFIVKSKFSLFLAPYATPETVIVAIPIPIHGKNAIDINLQAIVNAATSLIPDVIIIK